MKTKKQIHPSALAEILRAMEKDLKQKEKPAKRANSKGVLDEKTKSSTSPRSL